VSVAVALGQATVMYNREHGHRASALRGVPVCSQAFAGTHCTYPTEDGQAECLAAYCDG